MHPHRAAAAATDAHAACRRQRTVISAEQALAIFELASSRKKVSSIKIGMEFGISDKAVRDIWNGRTWAHVTKARQAAGQERVCDMICGVKVEIDTIKGGWPSTGAAAGSIDDVLFEWSETGVGLQGYNLSHIDIYSDQMHS
mmetsp:Transcript_27410/g.72347  ORF Transcript_27410/g.72347 Transcript_27410/m.72347 type:complete len:142 (+) Transcript_27410:267-692(+)